MFCGEALMGLLIGVANLANAVEKGDAEGVAWCRREFAEVSRVLAANGLPAYEEPERLPPTPDDLWWSLAGLSYGWFNRLQRAVAHARQRARRLEPLAEDESANADRRLRAERKAGQSHVVCHSDCDGFFIPVDFPVPLTDPRKQLYGLVLGSSQQALRELIEAASLLGLSVKEGKVEERVAEAIREGQDEHPLWVERLAWLYLFRPLQVSVELGTAVVLS
jgi:hypothetical protein